MSDDGDRERDSVGEEEEEEDEDEFEEGEDDFDPDELADLQKDAEEAALAVRNVLISIGSVLVCVLCVCCFFFFSLTSLPLSPCPVEEDVRNARRPLLLLPRVGMKRFEILFACVTSVDMFGFSPCCIPLPHQQLDEERPQKKGSAAASAKSSSGHEDAVNADGRSRDEIRKAKKDGK
jgi:hypothetical protein